jgi:hypothetical protein
MLNEDVVFLHPLEPVSLDAAVFQSLVPAWASPGGLSVADDLFEDFVVCLSSLETAWAVGEFGRLESQASKLASLSEDLGLEKCARLARQVIELKAAREDVALAAVVARVVRVGEASLASVLEFAYLRI